MSSSQYHEPVIRRVQESAPLLVEELVELHRQAFPDFFLTNLGPAFLRQIYGGFLCDPQGICLVAEENEKVVGLAVGTLAPAIFFRRLLRERGWALAWAAAPGLLRNFFFVAHKCLGALWYRGEAPRAVADAALLSSLAVSPAMARRGVGRALVREFARAVKAGGGQLVYLTTDLSRNESANRFYAHCGFELLDTVVRPKKRVMNRWIMRLS